MRLTVSVHCNIFIAPSTLPTHPILTCQVGHLYPSSGMLEVFVLLSTLSHSSSHRWSLPSETPSATTNHKWDDINKGYHWFIFPLRDLAPITLGSHGNTFREIFKKIQFRGTSRLYQSFEKRIQRFLAERCVDTSLIVEETKFCKLLIAKWPRLGYYNLKGKKYSPYHQ